MSDLVPLTDMIAFLGDAKAAQESPDGVLDKTLTQVEGLLEHDCNRELLPFQAAEPARAEIHDGTGRSTLWLDYPVETVLDAVLGHDVTKPEVIIDVTDPTELAIKVGQRDLRRITGNGGTFGLGGRRRGIERGPAWGRFRDPNFVHVTYDTADDLPDSAKIAVLRGTALLWRQRGVEEVKTQRMPDVTLALKAMIADMPEWQKAVDLNRRVTVA